MSRGLLVRKMTSVKFLVLFFMQCCSAFIISDLLKQDKWDGLKVTWGANPLGTNNFNSMPRTVVDANRQGFKKISDCDVNANWRGARYVKDNDLTLVLLYDVNGFIAGMQTTIPPGQSHGYPKASIQPPFVKDGDNYVLSAYFVDPAIICTTGRSASDFAAQGTGTNLYIQNGTSAEKDSIKIPSKETGMPATKWTKGKCFVTMGKHYWHNISDDMNCDDFFPVFLLYNNGDLTAFGWSLGTSLTSKHLEHPSKATYGLFMESVPKCLLNQGTLSTMHIYMTNNVYLDLC